MRRRTVALLAIVVAGLGIRIAYTLTAADSSKLTSLEGEMAHNIIAHGRWFERNAHADNYVAAISKRHGGEIIDPASVDYSGLDERGQWYPEIAQSVGPSVVIAAVWTLTGSERYIQIQILQGILDALTALLVYWIAMRLFKRTRVAIIAAALYALYPPIAWDTIDPYSDIWGVQLTIVLVALYLVMLRSGHRWRWLFACGLCAGLGAYFRPEVLLIVPFLALATMASSGRREALRRGLTATVVACLLLVPWTIRNFNDFHTFIPTRSAFWETAWEGLSELPNDFTAKYSAEPPNIESNFVPSQGYETPAREALDKRMVIEAITRHPIFYVEILLHRVALATVWIHETVWMNGAAQGVFSDKGGLLADVVDHPFEVLEYALAPLVFILAMVSLAFTWRTLKRENMILAAVVLSVFLPYLVVHVEERYLLPACFAFFIWIGLGADLLVERVRAHRGREVAGNTVRNKAANFTPTGP
jgi:4-amino-4-deoxy-L-arabinose transferase-like glycosyltransferase